MSSTRVYLHLLTNITRYSGGPLIALEKRLVKVEDGPENFIERRYIHDIPTCTDCRHKRYVCLNQDGKSF